MQDGFVIFPGQVHLHNFTRETSGMVSWTSTQVVDPPRTKAQLRAKIDDDMRFENLTHEVRRAANALAHTLIDCMPQGAALESAIEQLDECVDGAENAIWDNTGGE